MDETTTTEVEAVETETTEYPEWLTELINRLMQVLAKLLLKFSIKLAL